MASITFLLVFVWHYGPPSRSCCLQRGQTALVHTQAPSAANQPPTTNHLQPTDSPPLVSCQLPNLTTCCRQAPADRSTVQRLLGCKTANFTDDV